MKNYANQTLLLTALVILLLIALSFIPEAQEFGDFELRKMDIFSDIRKESAEKPGEDDVLRPDSMAYAAVDSTELLTPDSSQRLDNPPQPKLIPVKDSLQFGNLIEDYSFEQQGLKRFFEAVAGIKKGKTVRIAWYGDSFVEGDILLGDLRDSLQTLWGGKGVGFVPITSEVAQFKRTLKHSFRGWSKYSVLERKAPHPTLGISGFTYVPTADAKVHYEGADYFKNTRHWGKTRLFYSARQATPMVWQNEGMEPEMVTLPAKPGQLSSWSWERPGSIRAFAMRFPQPEGFVAYGASLEDGPGIYIDNFSIRGNSGGPLRNLDPAFMQEFDAIQQYNLVVLQVGLNAVTNSLNNIKWYRAELERTFTHLRKCFPNTPILIVSVGDRGGKIDGEIATMRGVAPIAAMQRELARQYGFLFYDLFHGMGGPGTMLRLANHHPRWANTDYTHLTHEGGRVVGLGLLGVLVRGQNKSEMGIQ